MKRNSNFKYSWPSEIPIPQTLFNEKKIREKPDKGRKRRVR